MTRTVTPANRATQPVPEDVARIIDERIAPLICPWDNLAMIARSCYIAGLRDGIDIARNPAKDGS